MRSTIARRPTRLLRTRARQAGVSMIELMVGVVIGLIATAVILQTFSVSEGYKRNTTSAGDAQQNGLFSTFTLSLELANAGNALATSGIDLATCPNTGDIATTLRPIPVVVTDSGDDNTPDSFVVHYSASNTLVYPALLLANTPKGGTAFTVQSPNGFRVGDMMVAISETGQCEWEKVTNVTQPDASGSVIVTVSTPTQQAYSQSATVLPMGSWDRVQRVRYDVVDANGGGACTTNSTNCALRSTNLNPPAPGAVANDPPQPLAANIVNMKVQYGVDTTGDGILDTWVSAANQPWRPQDILGATLPALNQVKAIRIGLIVRSQQYERDLVAAMPPKGEFNWVLFDCETHDNTCPGRL
ncbi:MAG TPA: PilW family protein, partial [Casimicrobiaceae bacterium]|nr:PilW family protein [Casimicrobiaceae bacterium]